MLAALAASHNEIGRLGGLSVAHLAAGCCCGFSAVAAGVAIGIVGDAGVRAVAHHNCAAPARLYVGMVLILIFAEALGLYGLIVGLILSSKGGSAVCGE